MTISVEDKWIGERLVEAGVINDEQRNKVLDIQSEPVNTYMRFGSLAVCEKFCTQQQIEEIKGFLGQLLVDKKLLTEEQVGTLLKLQKSMHEGRLHVPNFGELAVLREYCTKKDIERAIALNRRARVDVEAKLPEETSEW